MHLYDGQLFVSGTDPTDDWTFGNFYVRSSDGTWSKRRTIPNGIHCWGLCHDSTGSLCGAVACHAGDNVTWEGRIVRSSDDGLTWSYNVKLNNYRMMDIIEYGSDLYATGYDYADGVYHPQMWKHDTEWAIVHGVLPYRHQRLVIHDSKLIAADNGLSSLWVFDGRSWANLALPFRLRYPSLNVIASSGPSLYIASDNGVVWKSSNLLSWEAVVTIPNAISLSYWPSQSRLVASDCGPDAKLYIFAE